MENETETAGQGFAREASQPRERYFDDNYFEVPQLFSQALQIHYIRSMQPKSILEIGPGNGFTSSFLRRAGFAVTTADINAQLEPDICGSIEDLPHLLAGRSFDVIVCCEVLEHMPLDRLDENLRVMRSIGSRLFLTLPAYCRWVGFGGFLKLPWRLPRLIDLNFGFRKTADLADGPHFWEVEWSTECSRKAIERRLSSYYAVVRSGRFAVNPAHFFFIAE
jgi:SAM-dependent methyltransferase